MYPASKDPLFFTLILVVAVFNFAKPSQAHYSEQFHGEYLNQDVIDKFVLRSQSEDLELVVYRLDNKEPYAAPYAFQVYFRSGQEMFKKLKIKDENYCDLGIPQVTSDRRVFSIEAESLILPGYKLDDQNGECDFSLVRLDIHSLPSLLDD